MSRPRFIALLLALITLLAFLPVTRDGFINYDDNDYITENLNVQAGVTLAGIQWAFTTVHASNWHPLTWLSHMMDCGLFGLNPAAHHFVNALFHTANVVLLFVLLLRLTSLREDISVRQADSLWTAAFVAALFAWHPLHVESVAWVSERKDVLSTLFALLTLLAYTRYAKENCRRSFWVALICFALGLMAKPMLVTLPFVLLLLDYWPLKRISTITSNIFEKWPFFLLTAISCVVTYLAQRNGDAVVPFDKIALPFRLENALVAYTGYLQKIFWPTNLAVIYPLPKEIPTLAAILAAAILIFISAAAWLARKRSPYLLVGWLWFLGTLVPVIGIVQVGGAALADRYTYFPAVGIFIAVAFAVSSLTERFPFPKIVIATATAMILSGCLILTEKQLSYWRDSESLFAHALAVTKDNDIARLDLGVALEQKGKLEEALVQYREAARLVLGRYQIQHNLGNLLENLGRPEEALPYSKEAVRLSPNTQFLHNNLGSVLVALGRYDEAIAEFTEAARLDPTYPWGDFYIGKIRLLQGREVEAIPHFRKALQLAPDNFQILAYIAHVLSAHENPEVRDGQTALNLATKANTLTEGAQPFVLDVLAMSYAELGRFDYAQQAVQDAIDLANTAQMKGLEPLHERLELYKKHLPYRESFTNTLAKDFRHN